MLPCVVVATPAMPWNEVTVPTRTPLTSTKFLVDEASCWTPYVQRDTAALVPSRASVDRISRLALPPMHRIALVELATADSFCASRSSLQLIDELSDPAVP